ncbi:hypothetical protein [Pseudomonas taetrolens]|uniref:hypothetical protein n=1 Tax=Pseudomonas taetrolens TaxID=47884 RepID=UPI003F94A624
MKLTPTPDMPLSDRKRPSDDAKNALYVVSISKFVWLYVLTGSGYIFYWSYRNWASYRAATGVDIMPIMRGVFWPFFILSLFEKVQNGLETAGRSCQWYPEARGLLIMLLVLISVLLNPFFSPPSGTLFVFIADMVLIAAGTGLFVGAQRAINLLHDDPQGRSNSVLSVGNLVWMVLGGLHLFFVAIVAIVTLMVAGYLALT